MYDVRLEHGEGDAVLMEAVLDRELAAVGVAAVLEIHLADLVRIGLDENRLACIHDGGNGAVAFHREKYVSRGGPSGGDGGHGGNVVFRIDEGSNTLLAFRYHRKFAAENGENGKPGKKHGKNGEDGTVQGLLELAGIGPEQLGRCWLSGAFPAHSDLESAITIGIFPDLLREKYRVLRNSSLDGARKVLLDHSQLAEAKALLENIYCVQFASYPAFLVRMQAAKFIPHTDMEKFPSQKNI